MSSFHSPFGFARLCVIFVRGVQFGAKPVFNTQAVNYAGRHHYYSSEKAARDFG